jgi:hypothetical protein
MKKYFPIVGVVALAIGLAACSSTTPSSTQSNSGSTGNTGSNLTPTQQFGKDHGNDVRQLVSDIQSFSTDAQANNESAVYNDCQAIVNDAQTLQIDGPINNAAEEASWANALSSFVSGGQACMSGIQNQDSALIQQAGQDFASANAAISQMVSVQTA